MSVNCPFDTAAESDAVAVPGRGYSDNTGTNNENKIRNGRNTCISETLVLPVIAEAMGEVVRFAAANLGYVLGGLLKKSRGGLLSRGFRRWKDCIDKGFDARLDRSASDDNGASGGEINDDGLRVDRDERNGHLKTSSPDSKSPANSTDSHDPRHFSVEIEVNSEGERATLVTTRKTSPPTLPTTHTHTFPSPTSRPLTSHSSQMPPCPTPKIYVNPTQRIRTLLSRRINSMKFALLSSSWNQLSWHALESRPAGFSLESPFADGIFPRYVLRALRKVLDSFSIRRISFGFCRWKVTALELLYPLRVYDSGVRLAVGAIWGVFLRWRTKVLIICWRKWWEGTVEKERGLERLGRRFGGLKMELLNAAFASWGDWCKAMNERDERRRRFILKAVEGGEKSLIRRALGRWRRWQGWDKEAEIREMALGSVIRGGRKRIIRRALGLWIGFVGGEKVRWEGERNVGRLLRRKREGWIERGFRRWKEGSVRRRTAESNAKRVGRVIGKMKTNWSREQIKRATYRWKTLVVQDRERDDKLLLVLKRMGKQAQHTAMVTWKETTKRQIKRENMQKNTEGKLSLFFDRMQNRLYRRAMKAWRARVKCLDDSRVGARLLSRTIVRIVNKSLSQSFTNWISVVSKMKEREDEFRKIVIYMQNRALHSAIRKWQVWLEGLDKSAAGTKILRRTVIRLANKRLVPSLRKWKSFIAKVKEKEEKVAVGTLILRRTVVRIVNKRVFLSFGRWKSAVAEMKERDDKFRILIYRMQNRALHSAIRKWQVWLEGLDKSAAGTKILRRTVIRLANKRLVPSLRKWKSFIAKVKEKEEKVAVGTLILRRTVVRIVNKRVFLSFGRWKSAVAEMKERDDKFRIFIFRMQNRALHSALRTWRTRVGHIEDRLAGVRVLRKTVIRLGNKRLLVSLAKWKSFTAKIKEREEKFSLFSDRIQIRLYRRAMKVWRARVKCLGDSEAGARVLLLFFRRRKRHASYRSFHRWLKMSEKGESDMAVNYEEEKLRKVKLLIRKCHIGKLRIALDVMRSFSAAMIRRDGEEWKRVWVVGKVLTSRQRIARRLDVQKSFFLWSAWTKYEATMNDNFIENLRVVRFGVEIEHRNVAARILNSIWSRWRNRKMGRMWLRWKVAIEFYRLHKVMKLSPEKF